MYYIRMSNTAYGWLFEDLSGNIFRYYYGYSKRNAIQKFRQDFNLKYKRIHFYM